ncbi:MAG: hypothetical protein ACFFF4_05650 [Candidatus Thorarchaeota archaeon]
MSTKTKAGFLLLAIIMTINTTPTPVKGNPIGFTVTPTGGLLSTNQSLMMPDAYVDIVHDPTRINSTTFYQNTTIYGNYTITSTSAANTTLAFAYPDTWEFGYEVEILNHELELMVDGVRVFYQVMNASQFLTNFSYGSSLNDWLYSSNLLFATFNRSLQVNETLLLEVIANLYTIAKTDEYRFSYCVGTGRTWSGNSHERIRFEIKNYNQYLECRFFPSSSLSKTTSGTSLIGQWDLELSEFEEDYIGVTCVQYDWNLSAPDYFFLFLFRFGPIILILILIVVIVRKLEKRKQSIFHSTRTLSS